MKILIFVLTFLVSILLGCKKNANILGWNQVPLTTEIPNDCGCNKTQLNVITNFQTTVYGNVDSIFMKQNTINAIIVDTVSKTCNLISKNGIMISVSKICNYPAEMNKWDLSSGKSIEVLISGTVYQSCKGIIGPSIYTYSDLILNNLLKK